MAARRWCFTLNNPTSSLEFADKSGIRYAVWQKEEGELGTPHYQGYCCFLKPISLRTLKGILPTAHWEQCKGTHDQNKAYCTKETGRLEGPFEYGRDNEPEPGKRNDLEEIKTKLDAGASMKQIATEHFGDFIRYSRAFREYKTLITPERSWKTRVEVHWGLSDCGKSHYARTFAGAFWKNDTEWWCGYDAHEVVVIDEFYGWLTPSFMLRLFDQYPLLVNTKGGSAQFVAKLIIVLSNTHWHNWWRSDVKYSEKAMARRIELVKEYTEVYVPPPSPPVLEDNATATHEETMLID